MTMTTDQADMRRALRMSGPFVEESGDRPRQGLRLLDHGQVPGVEVVAPVGAEALGAATLLSGGQLVVPGGGDVSAPAGPRAGWGLVAVEPGGFRGEVCDEPVGDGGIEAVGEASTDRRVRRSRSGEADGCGAEKRPELSA